MLYREGDRVEYVFRWEQQHFSNEVPGAEGKIMQGTIQQVLPRKQEYLVDSVGDGISGYTVVPESLIHRKIEETVVRKKSLKELLKRLI